MRGGKSDIPKFVDHIAFWVPVLVLAIAENFNKLLQDGCLAPVASLGKLGGVVVMTIDLPLMLIIAVLGTKYCRAYGTSKVIDMVLVIKGRYVGSPECLIAFMA